MKSAFWSVVCSPGSCAELHDRSLLQPQDMKFRRNTNTNQLYVSSCLTVATHRAMRVCMLHEHQCLMLNISCEGEYLSAFEMKVINNYYHKAKWEWL